jgi:hypothetical protein
MILNNLCLTDHSDTKNLIWNIQQCIIKSLFMMFLLFVHN